MQRNYFCVWWLILPVLLPFLGWIWVEHPPEIGDEYDFRRLYESADRVEVRYSSAETPLAGKYLGTLKQSEAAEVFSQIRLKPRGKTFRVAVMQFWQFSFKRDDKLLARMEYVPLKEGALLQGSSAGVGFWPQEAHWVNPHFFPRFEAALEHLKNSTSPR